MRLQRAGLHAAHLRVAAEGHGRDAIAGLALREADGGAGQAQHELGHAHAEGPSGQVVAALVDEHKEADADNGADDHDEDVHRCLLIYERFPASRGRNRVSLVIIESGHPLSFPWRAVSENNYKLATIPPWFRRDVHQICRLRPPPWLPPQRARGTRLCYRRLRIERLEVPPFSH